MSAPQVRPGWYPDPSGAPGQRYFDGTAWTQHLAPVEEYPSLEYRNDVKPAESRFTIHYGFAVIAIISLLGTVIPAISMASDPGPQGYGLTAGFLWTLWGGMWTLIWAAFAIHHTLKSRR